MAGVFARRAGLGLSRGEARLWGPETKARGSDLGGGGLTVGAKPTGHPESRDEMFAAQARRPSAGVRRERRSHARA